MSEEEIRLIKGYFNDGYCCDLDELRNIANKMISENERLNNIIKEVREYIEKMTYDNPDTDFELEVNTVLGNTLEILDEKK